MLRRLRGSEGGFSLVEGVVALGLLGVVLSLLMQNLVGGFTTIAFARQRQAATGLANELLEQVRGADFDAVTMAVGDLAGDPAITGSGAAAQFRGRPVVAAPSAATPFAPHRSSVTPPAESTSYARALYVTQDPADPSSKLVTARVTWRSPKAGGAEPVVELETVVTEYACEAGSSSRPCEAYWYASATAEPATVHVTGTLLGQPVDVSTTLAEHEARLQTEQVTSVSATATAPATRDGATTSTPTVARSVADDDLGNPDLPRGAPDHDTQGTPPTPATVSRGDAAGRQASVSSRAAPGTAVRALATTESSGTVVGGTPTPNHGLPHARATTTGNGSAATTYSFTAAGTSQAGVPLVSIAAAGAGGDGLATADRSPGASTATPDDDSVRATASRTLGAVTVADLPAAARPAGFAGVARLSGWSTGAVAAAAGPAAPAVPAPSVTGTLEYWDGSRYTTLHPGQATTVDLTRTAGDCTYAVAGSLTAGSAVPTATAAGTATARVTSPVSGSLTYRVTCGGVSVADLVVAVDLGATVAEARFAIPGAS